MSVSIQIKDVVKRFGDLTVIPDLSIDVQDGEFFTLLGPSGCGKTTLLRMIAGFNSIEGGTISFNGQVINDMDPGKRNIGMVFQNYAIFPNMSVRKNVEFGLRYKKEKPSKEEAAKLTDEYLKLVHVDQYADRMPDRLSGGQQQRVALARALVIHPQVLLMDEPLSNLDAKLRVEMRTVIREIQRKVGITTIYVTHDQEEAMVISDRIAVMKDGVINHCGKPKSIYQRPANLFVASFIGKTNILDAKLVADGGSCRIETKDGYRCPIESVRPEEVRDRPISISVRPEEFRIHRAEDTQEGMLGTVRSSVFLGLNTNYFVDLDSGWTVQITLESEVNEIIPDGTKVRLTLNASKVNVFDPNTFLSLMQGVENSVETPQTDADREV
jgi:iron(III) transport system ATP-binding protein